VVNKIAVILMWCSPLVSLIAFACVFHYAKDAFDTLTSKFRILENRIFKMGSDALEAHGKIHRLEEAVDELKNASKKNPKEEKKKEEVKEEEKKATEFIINTKQYGKSDHKKSKKGKHGK